MKRPTGTGHLATGSDCQRFANSLETGLAHWEDIENYAERESEAEVTAKAG